MGAIDWERARPILEEALRLDAEEADSFVRAQWKGSAEECERLLGLMHRERAASTFLRSPERPASSPGFIDGEALASGSLVGPFRLVRPIGEGGMGSVWYAEREGDFSQSVAIKILRPDRLTAEYEQRFRRERSLLARLQHPGIARLIDGGVLSDGASFLAMEYVDGREVDVWVRETALGVRGTLELFLKICDAVQAAHEAGIVHRDIKPSNVLVTEEGQPKLLDFGIAKLAQPDDRESLLLTQTGDRLLTPRYASPEQVRGEPVSQASDVYALGVLLFELLTGRSPHGDSSTWNELEDAILHEAVRRPSACADRGRRTELRGDLDVVVVRALAKEPGRRYAGARELSADIRRHIDGLPIHARPDSKLYRASKFVRRNRLFVAATVIVVGTLVTGLAVSHHNYVLAEDAREQTTEALGEAQLRRAIADEVNRFLADDLLRGADPTKFHNVDVRMRTVLDQAAERIEGRFPDAPLVEAAIRYAIGGTYLALGLPAAAEPHCRRAYELRLEHAGPFAIETLEAGRDLANAMGALGDYQAQIRFSEELIERMEPVLGLEDGYLMVVRANLSLAYGVVGRQDEAIAIQRQLLEQRRRIFGDQHPSTLKSYHALGSSLMGKGKDEEALPFLRKAVELRTKLLGEDDPTTLLSRGNLAALQARGKHFEEAFRNYLAVYEAQVRVQGKGHPYTIRTAANLSAVAMWLKKENESSEWARIAWDGWRSREEELTAEGLSHAKSAMDAFVAASRFDEAEALAFQALELSVEPKRIAELELHLATVYDRAGRAEDAALLRASAGL